MTPYLNMYIDIHTHHSTHDDAVTSIVNSDASAIASSPASVGIHPWKITERWKEDFNEIKSAASKAEVAAIGECGIDKVKSPASIEVQREVLKAHIDLAEEVKKPLILHCVRGAEEIVSLHKETAPQQAWIIHGFRGKPQLAGQLLREGFFLSYGDKFNSESLAATPLDRLFIESDTGEKDIKEIYATIASAKGTTIERLARAIEENARRCRININCQ